MSKNYLKKISLFLVLTLGITLFPETRNVYADEVSKQITNDKNEIKEEASIVKEVEELRDEYSKQFLKSDGTFEVVVYNKPIHYNDNNKWIEIDNTLKESLDKELKELDEKEKIIDSNTEEDSTHNDSILEEGISKDNNKKENNPKDETINSEINEAEKNNQEDKALNNQDISNIEENSKNENKEKQEDNKKVDRSNKQDKTVKEKEKEEENKAKLEKSKNIRKNDVNNILTNENNLFSVDISKYSDSNKLIKIKVIMNCLGELRMQILLNMKML